MSRGKYAARAAQSRAESAAAQANQSTEKLQSEREQHAAEIKALKIQIETLSANLTRGVADLADERVRRVESECENRLRREREGQKQAAQEVFRIFAASLVSTAPDAWHLPESAIYQTVRDMAEALNTPMGEAWYAVAAKTSLPTNRKVRRLSTSGLTKVVEDANHRNSN